MGNNNHPAEAPLIPASQSLREITLRAVVIGVILTIILAAANAYLGLKLGQTVSASVPAAIISMSILRFFRNSNVLENTMVQTMASVGEALIAGVAFIMPALLILHIWTNFYYWQTVCIAALGGIVGVLFTIPLRRALLEDRSLRYPEGFAISNVLKASATRETSDVKALAWGGLVGAVISLFQTGFEILTDTYDFWFKSGSSVYGFELGLSPALIAAGYIVGLNVAVSFMIGIIIGWIIGIPVLTAYFGMAPGMSAGDVANSIWHTHLRLVGVGTMLVGGLWTLCTLLKPISRSISASIHSLREAKINGKKGVLRTERDIPINYVFWCLLLLLLPIFFLLVNYIVPQNPAISTEFRNFICGFTTIYVLVGGFLFCSISAYFAGLIGSSNNPVSGMLICSLLILCLSISGLFYFEGGLAGKELFAVMLAIGSSVIVCVGLAISNDTMQDLKVGQIVGATPWKQQAMLILGVFVSAVVVPPILNLLFNAYGIGGIFPHPGMDKAQMLSAPQAALMATVAQGVYTHQLEWNMVILGCIIAVICIIVDEILKKSNRRLPVLAVGLAIYLPMNSTVPVVIGGLLSALIQARLNKRYRDGHGSGEKKLTEHRHRGLLLACGMVASSSIMGVVLAVPFVIYQSSDALKIIPAWLEPFSGVLSLVVTYFMCVWMYRYVMKARKA